MDNASPVVLLMTATVNPNGCPQSKFSIPERIAQYQKALRFYVERLCPELGKGGYNRIVFAENSGADMACFSECISPEKKDAVELLSLPPSDFDSKLGKGYNEEKIIDEACDKSKFLTEDTFFFKVTGRYSILNINHFVKDIRKKLPDLDFYCDVKDHHVFSSLGLKWRQTWCDTRHIGFRVSFWRKHIYGHEEELLAPWAMLETQMFALSRKVRTDPRTSHRCKQEIFINGLNGHPDKAMHLLGVPIPRCLQIPYFLLRSVQSTVLRWIFPSLWI